MVTYNYNTGKPLAAGEKQATVAPSGQIIGTNKYVSGSSPTTANAVGTIEQQKAAGNVFNTLTGDKLNYGTVTPVTPESTTIKTDILNKSGNVTFPPKTESKFDAMGNIAGSQAATDYYTNVTLAQDNVTKRQDETQSLYDKLMGSIPTAETNLAQSKKISGMDEAQRIANEENAKLQTVIRQGQANQQMVVGQGRGIPEAIIGGQQAQFARETAIQALPIQASLEAAQGNLAAATATFDKLFTAKQQDAQNKLSYGMKVIDTFAQYANEKDKIALDYVKQQEQRKYDSVEKNKTAIQNLATEALKYGMTSTTGEALANIDFTNPNSVAKAQSLVAPYLAKANRELKSVGDNLYMWDKNTNKLTLVGGGGGTGGTGTITNPAYAGIVKTILGSGKFTKDQSAQVANAINNGEDPLSVIKNNAKGIMTSTEATKLGSFETAKGALMDLDLALKEYYANGGKSNIFKGNLEKTINKLGEVSDPKLVEISTRIQAVLQVYRNAVSGTAYSVQESKDIDSIFPGITKSEGLNTAILNGRKKAFDATIDTTYGNVLGQDTYQKLKELETVKNNIPKGTLDDKSYVEKVLVSKNIRYDDFINQTPPNGQIPVIDNSTGEVGYIPYVEFSSSKYTKI